MVAFLLLALAGDSRREQREYIRENP